MWIRLVGLAAATLISACAIGCGQQDPAREVLEHRARWKVELKSIAEREDGTGLAQFQLAGPVRRKLDALTIRIDLLGDDGVVRESVWHTFDLTDIVRGTPTEKMVRVPALDPPAQGVTFSRVLEPTIDERPFIEELSAVDR